MSQQMPLTMNVGSVRACFQQQVDRDSEHDDCNAKQSHRPTKAVHSAHEERREKQATSYRCNEHGTRTEAFEELSRLGIASVHLAPIIA